MPPLLTCQILDATLDLIVITSKHRSTSFFCDYFWLLHTVGKVCAAEKILPRNYFHKLPFVLLAAMLI